MRQFATAEAAHASPRFSVHGMLRWVLLALLPGALAQCLAFGIGVLIQMLLACGFALACEALCLRLRGRALAAALGDGSAVVTAVLFALCLPPLTPWWISAFGMFIAIGVAKHADGGLGRNQFNPAMVAVAAVSLCFPWALPWPLEESATPWNVTLETIFSLSDADSQRMTATAPAAPEWTLSIAGELAPTLGYALGGLLLLCCGVIRWQAPTALLLSCAVLALALHRFDAGLFLPPWTLLQHGSWTLAAFFVATDPVTGCITPRGRLCFGVGVGLLSILFQNISGPAGIAFAVLSMNALARWIDQRTPPRRFAQIKPAP